MATARALGFGRLASLRRSPQPFVACYAHYAGQQTYLPPPIFGSFEEFLNAQVYGPSGSGSVRDYVDRLLGVELVPVGGREQVWVLPTITETDYQQPGTAQLRSGPELRGLARQRLMDLLAASGIDLHTLDADGDDVLEAPDRVERSIENRLHPHEAPEILLLVIDNLSTKAGQTGAATPDACHPPHALTWAGDVSGIAVDAGAVACVHELLHQLGAVDLYGADMGRNRNRSVMAATPDNESARYRLDPWHEMQFGTVDPVLGDLGIPGEVLLQHAGSVDWTHRALLLASDERPFDGFLVQLRLGPEDPVDRDTPAGWYVWQVAVEPGVGSSRTVPSCLLPSGLDASVNLLGSPDLRRGDPTQWYDGDLTPELRWLDGAETGTRLRFSMSADGLSGRVGWEPVTESWRVRGPDVTTTMVADPRPAQEVALTVHDGNPVVGVLRTEGVEVSTVLGGGQRSPWAVPAMFQDGRGLALASGPDGVLLAFTAANGAVFVDYPPYFDAPVNVGATDVETSVAATWLRQSPVLAWSSRGELWVAAYLRALRRWELERVPFDDESSAIAPLTGPALTATATKVYLAWSGRLGGVRVRRSASALGWRDTMLTAGGRVPVESEHRLGWAAAGTPAMAVGGDGAVWLGSGRGSQTVEITRCLPGYGVAEGARTGWWPLTRGVEVAAGAKPALATAGSGLWIAGSTANAPVTLSFVPTPATPT